MLRLIALALLLANLLYFGWTLGWLDAVVGIRAQGDREPHRLQRQLRPELIELSAADTAAEAAPPASAESAAAAATTSASAPASAAHASATHAAAASASSARAGAAPAATTASATAAARPPSAVANAAKVASAANGEPLACLEAGPFAAADLAAAEAAIRAAVPAASWTQRRVAGSGEWMIYMGPYPDEAWIERKKAELSRIRGGGLAYEAVGPTAQLGRGISLGRFDSQAAAAKQLEDYRPRGIRTARVVQSGDGPGKTFLRIAKADPALVERLGSVKWPAAQDGFKPCVSSR